MLHNIVLSSQQRTDVPQNENENEYFSTTAFPCKVVPQLPPQKHTE